MLTPDLVNKLSLIAFEGWEYHKLPLEDPEDWGNSRAEEKLSPLTLPSPGTPGLLWDKTELTGETQMALKT